MITDEELSAFLDNELDDAGMERIRDAIAESPELAERVEALAMVDAQLKFGLHKIDERPMPKAIEAMLNDTADTEASVDEVSNVLPFRRVRKHTPMWLGGAIAACLVVVVGTQWDAGRFAGQGVTPQQLALTELASGESRELDEGSLRVNLSFRNGTGELCRQYSLYEARLVKEGIACLREDGWQTMALQPGRHSNALEFQTASGRADVDAALDEMQAQPVSLAEERVLIERGWEWENE